MSDYVPIDNFGIPNQISRKVVSPNDLDRGMHIAMGRLKKSKCNIYYHHAIVESVAHDGVWLIEFTTRDETVDYMRNFYTFEELSREKLYKVIHGYRSDTETIIERALMKVKTGKSKAYNVITHNCEHFANWCVEGYAYSVQVGNFLCGVTGAAHGINPTCNLVASASVSAVKQIPFDEVVLGISTSATRSAVRGVAIGSIAVAGGITAAAEAGFTAYDIYQLKKRKDAGAISKRQYQDAVGSRVGVAATSVAGTVGGSVIGQILIPVPMVGAAVGGLVGCLVGKVSGNLFGKMGRKARKMFD